MYGMQARTSLQIQNRILYSSLRNMGLLLNFNLESSTAHSIIQHGLRYPRLSGLSNFQTLK